MVEAVLLCSIIGLVVCLVCEVPLQSRYPSYSIFHLYYLSDTAFGNDIPVAELPPGVPSELLSMITKTTLQATGSCSYDKEAILDGLNLLLYTREGSSTPTKLNVTNPILNPKKKVILLIHGWISSPKSYGMPDLKDAFLKRYDSNIIIVDWSKIAWNLYTTSVCALPLIAETVADVLCHFDRNLSIPADSLHLVGHSLGGQMSGLIGQNMINECGRQIGRITAMDPAGPLFQNFPKHQRLDSGDAEFVDVIHTNEGALGYWGNCGDVDFHVNCGVIQLGCPDTGFGFTIEQLKHATFELVACHHLRSIDYMIESTASSRFRARSCPECPLACIPNLFRSGEIVMGEDCPRNSPNGGYVLATNLQPPYGLGSPEVFSALSAFF